MPIASADISMRDGRLRVAAVHSFDRVHKGVLAGLLGCLVLLSACSPKPGSAFDQDIVEPRGFGWQLGDRLSRTVHLSVPAGWVLDPASLPRAGKQGGAVEFVRVARLAPGGADGDAWQLGLQVDYQIMQSPDAPRSVDLPGFVVRFDPAVGASTTEPNAASAAVLASQVDAAASGSVTPVVVQPTFRELRIPAFAVIVTPLVGQPTPTGRAWGDMRPDTPAPLLSRARQSWGLVIGAGMFGFGLLGLLLRPLFDAWWSRRQLPMARAKRKVLQVTQSLSEDYTVASALRDGGGAAQGLRSAFRHVHGGFDAWAGRVFAQADLATTLRQVPAYVIAEGPAEAFFAASQLLFFGAFAGARTGDAIPAPGDYRVGDLKVLMAQLAAAERSEWGRRPGSSHAPQSAAPPKSLQS